MAPILPKTARWANFMPPLVRAYKSVYPQSKPLVSLRFHSLFQAPRMCPPLKKPINLWIRNFFQTPNPLLSQGAKQGGLCHAEAVIDTLYGVALDDIHLKHKPDLFPIYPLKSHLQVLNKLKKGADYPQFIEAISVFFLQQLNPINAYLKGILQKLLNDESYPAEFYEQTLYKLRIFCLFFLSQQPGIKAIADEYESYLSQALGNYPRSSGLPALPDVLFSRLFFVDQSKRQELHHFIYFFTVLRRFSQTKLHSSSLPVDMRTQTAAVRTLFSATWFHGTHALQLLPFTDYTLYPSGELHSRGKVPFFGEVGPGCQKRGVNQEGLSGTALDHVDWSIHTYSQHFAFSFEKEQEHVENFCQTQLPNSDNLDIRFLSDSPYFPRKIIAIKRWALWDPESFESIRPQIRQQLMFYKTELEKLRKAVRLQEMRWPGDLAKAYFENFDFQIQDLLSFLDTQQTPLTPLEKTAIKTAFSAVLGSSSLVVCPSSIYFKSGEIVYKGPLKLGKHLTFICVNARDKDRALSWLAEQRLTAVVALYDMEDLIKARQLYQLASPTLADILGVNELKELALKNQKIRL